MRHQVPRFDGNKTRKGVARRLRALRRAVRPPMTVGDLAARAGISSSLLDRLERGDRDLTVELTYRLSVALKVTLRDLLEEVDGQFPCSCYAFASRLCSSFQRMGLTPDQASEALDHISKLLALGRKRDATP